MTARLFAGQPAESGVLAVRGIKRKKFSISKRRFAHQINQAAVKFTQLLLGGRKLRAVVLAIVDPLREFRHRPVIEDARARVAAAKTFRAFARLADFLAVIEDDRTAGESVENG